MNGWKYRWGMAQGTMTEARIPHRNGQSLDLNPGQLTRRIYSGLMQRTNGAYEGSWTFAGTTVRNADIRRITNQPPLSSITKSRRLTFFGNLHEWMRMQTPAKPSSNLHQRTGGDHQGSHAQPG